MRNFTHKAVRRGFTLIELIVVIAILATLMGIAFPAIMGFRENANISSASKTCMDIVSGVNSFKQDHNGILPFRTDQAKPNREDQIYLITEFKKDAGMLAALTGYEEGDDKLNINNEAYIKPTKADKKEDGLYGEGDELSLYDPWGMPYYVVLCEMDDGCIDPFTHKRQRRENCLVYSTGPDKDGIADAHTGKRKKTAGAPKGKKAKEAAKLAAQEAEDALQDNVYSWKKSVKK